MFPVRVLTFGDNLTPLQQRTAFRQLGFPKVPDEEDEIQPDDCLRLWVFMLLGRLQFMSPEQRTLVFEEIGPDLSEKGVALWDAMHQPMEAGEIETPMLAVADGRFVTWSGKVGWLDLTTGETVRDIEHQPLETVGYNLAVLFGRNAAKCQQIKIRLETQDATSNPEAT